ncbi:MAG: hypothetical protein JNK82_22260 [Myxococcaceae bacterium]|nr:hypothetical protein [Myxococcaceae bacterium]
MADHVLIDLRLLPRWELVGELRRLVSQSLEKLSLDADDAYGASLAAHELLENAVKYGQGEVRVTVHLDRREKKLRGVSVENRTTRSHAARLKRALKALSSAPDRMAAYVALMGRGPGGLGLARIAAEAEMQVTCTARANRVAVIARPQGAAHA